MMCTFLKVYEESEHVAAFKDFHEKTWPQVRRLLEAPGDVVPADIKEPVLLIACHIARIMNRYWTELQLGRKPNLPSYNSILTVVDDNKWHLIQHDIPNHYRDMLAKLKSPQRGLTVARLSNWTTSRISGSGTRNNDWAAPRSGGPISGASDGGKVEGERKNSWKDRAITNPELDAGWHSGWKGDGRTITTLKAQGNVPKAKVQGELQPICLAWNLKGECNTNCGLRYSHFCSTAAEFVPRKVLHEDAKRAIQADVDGLGKNGENAKQNE
jgi:hypothetical protein